MKRSEGKKHIKVRYDYLLLQDTVSGGPGNSVLTPSPMLNHATLFPYNHELLFSSEIVLCGLCLKQAFNMIISSAVRAFISLVAFLSLMVKVVLLSTVYRFNFHTISSHSFLRES